jgi:type II secretory pathway pseudopilin PulG
MNTPAHCRSRTTPAQAFTVTELLIVITCLAILAAVLLAALKRQRWRGAHVSCANNIKQICLSFIVWSSDNNNHFPMQVPVANGGTLELVAGGKVYPHFQVLSNELNTPRIFHCWEDDGRLMTASFNDLSDRNVSYFLNVDAMVESGRDDYREGASVLLGDRNITNRALAGSRLVPVTKANTIAWTKDLHSGKGYLGFADGRVGLFTNRIAGLARAAGTGGTVAADVSTAIHIPDAVTNRLAVP